jgi:toxin-antitoxin system PIN domain toxin
VSAHLLDTNLLIALAWPQHVHHAQAHEWFAKAARQAWSTCAITQLGFIRVSSNPKIIRDAVSPREALAVLKQIIAVPGHRFWPDQIAPADAAVLSSLSLVGHRQVTDAYLLALAQHHGGRLATFDKGVAELIQSHKERSRHVTLIA